MSETVFSLENVSFRFPEDDRNTLTGISFTVARGERVVLTGPSGCGKSTLLYLLNRLYPANCDGIVVGDILLFNKPADQYAPGEINHRIATVFQDPDSQFCMPTVEEELAFTLENLQTPAAEMEERITRILEFTDLYQLRNVSIQTLSGGMKQRVAMACALVMEPEVLLLDEPISHLDPFTAREFIGWLEGLQQNSGMTILAVEHRTDSWGSFFDREISLDPNGTLLSDRNFTPQEAQRYHVRLNSSLEPDALMVEELSVKIKEKTILHPLTFSAQRGECVVIAGPNGSGKSTLVKTICGIYKKAGGKISSAACGYVPQSPEFLFLTSSVQKELAFSKISEAAELDAIMEALRLAQIAGHNPFAVSHGQKRRVAIGAMLADKRKVLFLDEPTSGQDRAALLELFRLVDERLDQGDTLFIVTHDMEFAAAVADSVLLMKEGRLTGKFPAKALWENPVLLEDHHLLPPKGVEQSAESTA